MRSKTRGVLSSLGSRAKKDAGKVILIDSDTGRELEGALVVRRDNIVVFKAKETASESPS